MSAVTGFAKKAILERGYWAVAVAVWIALSVALFVHHLPELQTHAPGPGLYILAAVLNTTTAGLITAFIVAIPLRILLNLMFRERRRSRRKETLLLVGVLAAGCGWAAEYSREIKSLAPPPGVTAFEPFVASMPAPSFIRSFRHEGRTYIAWYGDFAGPIALPSGPACYLFDDQGALVDWQAATGDGGPVEQFLKSAAESQRITLEEARAITQRHLIN